MAVTAVITTTVTACSPAPVPAYRPIIFNVTVSTLPTAQPPVVYCDVYFGGIYYKTIAKTLPSSTSNYTFDISDVAQEYLTSFVGPNSGDISKYHLASPVYTVCKLKIRVSTLDANGFVLPTGTAPVQATDTTPAVSGEGSPGEDFFIVNATLQHELNFDMKSHLGANRTALGGTWAATTWPLTDRPANYKVCKGDIDYFPIFTSGLPDRLFLTYVSKAGVPTNVDAAITLNSGTPETSNVYYIPNGPKNLAVLFPSINWNDVASYTVQIKESDLDILATWTQEMGCCCTDERVRIQFRNAMGTIDAISFMKPEEEHQNSSSSRHQISLPDTLTTKKSRGNNRGNVRSNEIFKGLNQCYTEVNKNWIYELMDSTDAYVDWIGIEGFADDYLPIIIEDSKFVGSKAFEKYFYDFSIEYSLANENINHRN